MIPWMNRRYSQTLHHRYRYRYRYRYWYSVNFQYCIVHCHHLYSTMFASYLRTVINPNRPTVVSDDSDFGGWGIMKHVIVDCARRLLRLWQMTYRNRFEWMIMTIVVLYENSLPFMERVPVSSGQRRWFMSLRTSKRTNVPTFYVPFVWLSAQRNENRPWKFLRQVKVNKGWKLDAVVVITVNTNVATWT